MPLCTYIYIHIYTLIYIYISIFKCTISYHFTHYCYHHHHHELSDIHMYKKIITVGFLQSKAFQLAQFASWVPDNAPAMMPKTPAPKGPTMLAVAPMVTPGPSRIGNFHLGDGFVTNKTRSTYDTVPRCTKMYQVTLEMVYYGLLWFTMVYWFMVV